MPRHIRTALLMALVGLVTTSPVAHASARYSFAGAIGSVTRVGAVSSARYTVAVPDRHVRTSGWLAWPVDGGAPSTLFVAAHGCCEVGAHPREAVRAVGYGLHAVGVAMDFERPTTYAPDLAADDLAAAITDLRKRIPSIRRVVVYATSMGGEASGLMIARHPGLVTDWIVVSGVVDLATTRGSWQASDPLQAHLGTLVDAKVHGSAETYTALSPTNKLQGKHNLTLKHVWLFYGRLDAVVPLSTGEALQRVLAADHVPTTLSISEPTDAETAPSDAWHVDSVSVQRSIATMSCVVETGHGC